MEETGFGGLAIGPNHHALPSLYGKIHSVSKDGLRNDFSKLGIICVEIVYWPLNTSENRVANIMLSVNGLFFPYISVSF